MVFFLSSERLKADLLNDNVADENIKSAVIISQQDLMEMIGDSLYNKLAEMVTDGTIEDTPYQELLDSFIVPYLEFKAMSELCFITSYKVGNIGLYQNYDNNANSNELSTIKYVQHHWEQKGEFYRNRMIKYLNQNKDKFPEYTCGCQNLTNPSENSITKTVLWLGGR